MKRLFILLPFVLWSCSKQEAEQGEDVYIQPKYDTTAIDSFSVGATSVNVASEIKKSSKVYQDSLLAIAKAQEAELKKKKREDSIKTVQAKKEKEQAKIKETASSEKNDAEANH